MAVYRTTKDGTTPITPGVGNNQGVNVPLITFDSIIDTDFGIMLYIDRYFLDTSIFNVDFFNSHHKINEMVKALITREEKNPLSLCIKDISNREKVQEDLFREFRNGKKHYEKILELSMFTCVWQFLQLANMPGSEVNPTVICRTESEKAVLKRYKYNGNVILIDEEIDGYQQYYFRCLDDEYTNAVAPGLGQDKSIYIARYKFNEYERLADGKSPFLYFAATKFSSLCYYNLYDPSKLFPKEEKESNE